MFSYTLLLAVQIKPLRLVSDDQVLHPPRALYKILGCFLLLFCHKDFCTGWSIPRLLLTSPQTHLPHFCTLLHEHHFRGIPSPSATVETRHRVIAAKSSAANSLCPRPENRLLIVTIALGNPNLTLVSAFDFLPLSQACNKRPT